jgi:hypothetical protein
MERIILEIFFPSKRVVGSLMILSFYDLPIPFFNPKLSFWIKHHTEAA